MIWTDILTYVIVAIATLYLTRRWWRRKPAASGLAVGKDQSPAACSSCNDCGTCK